MRRTPDTGPSSMKPSKVAILRTRPDTVLRDYHDLMNLAGYQDVIAMGHLFLEGRYNAERVISLAGPMVREPKYYRTVLGASIEDLCKGRIKDGEVFVNNLNISVYTEGNRENHEPTRVRKLLLHHAEIDKLTRKVEERGFSLIPTKIYFKESRVKLEIGIARGKQLHDKRETLKRKEADREMAKAVKASR